ncbi:MAG: ROK family protein [Oscillospiraceae bacterium]|nr:ROK family protein [Oscillospiraceae bacterium]
MQAALCRKNGAVIRLWRGRVDISAGAEGILAWLDGVVSEIIEFGGYDKKPEGIGIGFGGIVEKDTGSIAMSVQVQGWEGVSLKKRFEERFGLPVRVENDTVCAGLAEYRLGSGRGAESFFYTNIGSGIGGALFIGGQPVLGQKSGAAYFGHTWVPSWDIPGKPEKIENLCSGFAIERRLQSFGYVPKDSLMAEFAKTDEIDCRTLGRAANSGDAFALREIDRIAESFGLGIANILTLFHPEIIVIGGGVSNLGDLILNPIRKYAKHYAFEPCKTGFSILPCGFTEDAVLIGAAIMAAERITGVNL